MGFESEGNFDFQICPDGPIFGEFLNQLRAATRLCRLQTLARLRSLRCRHSRSVWSAPAAELALSPRRCGLTDAPRSTEYARAPKAVTPLCCLTALQRLALDPERWSDRQVLECGDGVGGSAAFRLYQW